MAKATQDDREALRQAAEAVRPRLEKLLQERASLDRRIAPLQGVIDAYDSACGKLTTKHLAKIDNGKAPERTKRGQVSEHINAVLSGGVAHEEPEIRKLIAQRFGIVHGRATVYSALRRGAYEYDRAVKKWRLKA